MTKCHNKSNVELLTFVKAWYDYVDKLNCEILVFLKLCNDTLELVNKIEYNNVLRSLAVRHMCKKNMDCIQGISFDVLKI
jgi:hypothetical protein